jgi:hypothetical protein
MPLPFLFSGSHITAVYNTCSCLIYEQGSWSLALKEELILSESENWVWKGIFGPGNYEVAKVCKKLHYVEFYIFNPHPILP